MKREIPQKIDTALMTSGKLVNQPFKTNGVSTLLRRTRSVSVLGFVITVSAFGGLATEQAANALAFPAYQKSSARSIQPLELIGSPQYPASIYLTTTVSSPSKYLSRHAPGNPTFFAANPGHPAQMTRLFAAQPNLPLVTTGTPVESSRDAQPSSFTHSTAVESSQFLLDEFISPLTSKTLLDPDIFTLQNSSDDIPELITLDVLDSIATQAIEPSLLVESPQQYLLKLDQLMAEAEASSSHFSTVTDANPLDLSTTLAVDDEVDTEIPTTWPSESEQSLAVVPDIDLSQTIIPNNQNSALIDSGAIVHQVKPGETLEDISRLYQVAANEITKANRISDPASIGPKTKLRIPAHQSLSLSFKTAQVPADLNDALTKDELQKAPLGRGKLSKDVQTSIKPGGEASQKQTAKANLKQPRPLAILPSQPIPSTELDGTTTTIATRSLLPQVPSLELPPLSSVDRYLPSQMLPGPQKYLWPAKGVLTSGFGWRWGRPHRGIDIAAPVGTPVIAAAPGVIKTAGWNRWGYGNLVEIKHPDGSLTLYAHNNSIKARVGQSVSQGQQIAEMGSTGRSTGPHTHFEIHPPGKGAINPVPLLRRL